MEAVVVVNTTQGTTGAAPALDAGQPPLKTGNQGRVIFFVVSIALLIAIQTSLLDSLFQNVVSAEQAKIWADKIRSNTVTAAAALIVAFYLDVFRFRAQETAANQRFERVETSLAAIAAQNKQAVVDSFEPSELVQLGLRSRLGQQARNIDNLTTTVVGQEGSVPVYECDVEHILASDPNDPSVLKVRRISRAVVNIPEYVVAVARTDDAGELSAYHCPRIWETWHTELDLRDAGRELVAGTDVTFMPQGGNQFETAGDLTPVPEAQYVDYLGQHAELLRRSVKLYRLQFAQPLERLTISSDITLSEDCGVLWYQVDGPTYLQSISFDTTDHLPGREVEYGITLFVGAARSAATMETARKTAEVYNWIGKGHGAMLWWSK